METLAFTYAAVAHEDPNPAPELQINLHFPSSAWLGTVSAAVVVSAVVGVAPEAQAVVRVGDVCPAVGDVQSALSQSGFNPGSVDNVFGQGTLSAVISFQNARGLSPDGVVGPSTADALGLGDAENSDSPFLIGNSCAGGGGGGGGGGGAGTITISTNGSPLTIRSGPGTGYGIVGSAPNGASYSYVDYYNGWYEISGGGWVSGDWVYEGGSVGSGSGGGGGGGGGGGAGTITISTNGSPLTIRSGPGAGYAAIDYVPNGASYSYVDYYNGWYELAGGGWVSGDWVYEGGSGGSGGGGGGGGGSADSVTVSTNGGELTVRSGPGTGYAAVGYVLDGVSVAVVDYYNGWYQLAAGGWISGDWVY